MARVQKSATGPARLHEGIPIIPDGSRRHPLLVALPGDQRNCNNGCETCLTQPVALKQEIATADLSDSHVVIRDREPTLNQDLARFVADLRSQKGKAIALLTNGRMLGYPALCRELELAGLERCIVKLFGIDADTHDQHTRVTGSYEQAVRGIETARAANMEVLITFPKPARAEGDEKEVKAKRHELAQQLTDCDPIEMPEPEVEAHAGEYRYEAVLLSDAGKKNSIFKENFFPMVHVQTGPVCNIRCTYCNVRGGDDQRQYEREDIMRTVDASVEQVLEPHDGKGHPTLDYIGGEPTLHPDLAELITYAREQGFPDVSICTNGVMFHKRQGYLDSLIDAGMSIVRYSFHDHRSEYANRFAAINGLGEHYPDTAKLLLSRRDLHVHLYRILLSENLDVLPDYLRWLDRENKTGKPLDLSLGLPSLRGRMFDNPDLYPSLDSLRSHVADAIDVAEELGVELFIHHAPACLYPQRPDLHACLNVDTLQIKQLSGQQEIQSFEGGAVYGDACARCPGRELGCHGLPKTYWDMGVEEAEDWLTPVEIKK